MGHHHVDAPAFAQGIEPVGARDAEEQVRDGDVLLTFLVGIGECSVRIGGRRRASGTHDLDVHDREKSRVG